MENVKMLKTMLGSPNGIEVNTYSAGKEYTMNAELADVFIKIGAAVKAVEEKAVASAPANKAFKVAPEVKAVEEEKEETGEHLPEEKPIRKK